MVAENTMRWETRWILDCHRSDAMIDRDRHHVKMEDGIEKACGFGFGFQYLLEDSPLWSVMV